MAAESPGGEQEAPKQRCGPKPKELNPWMERSAGITDHPLMRELHSHLEKHKEEAHTSESSRDTLRGGGREIVDKRMKELALELEGTRGNRADRFGDVSAPMTPANLLTQVRACSWSPMSASSGTFSLTQPPVEETPVTSPTSRDAAASASAETAQQRLELVRSPGNPMDRFSTAKTRYRYQSKTDKTLKRLFVDMDLARDERQQEYGFRTRCEHLDKVFAWYDKSIHVIKEDQKERKVPPYVVFKKDDPVPPGSMRVQRVTRPSPLLKAWELGQSSSSPALIADAAGSATGSTGE